MKRQDTSPLAANGEITDQVETSESTSLERRRALLSGLGKGGALVAAVAPVSSFAAGRVRTADGKQCTVSGQMSAVMSQAASVNPCAAFHPTSFFNADTVLISTLLPDAYRLSVEGAAIGSYIVNPDGLSLDFKRSDTEVRKLTPANRPTGYNAVGLMASDILSGASAVLVLKVLHSASESDTAYFLAAFFSALLTAPSGAEKVPFAETDVQAQWLGPNKAAAAALYRLISTVGLDTTKLG